MDVRRTFPETLRLIDSEYRRHAGESLAAGHGADAADAASDADRLAWLHEDAPFALLAYDASEDARFLYVNATAQRTFGYSYEEFLGLPSRLSAAEDAWAAREALLARVYRDGFVHGYEGIRVTKDGRRFWIRNCELWTLVAADGTCLGQAARVWPET